MTKQSNGQFYTTNASYMLDEFPSPPSHTKCIVEPFAGNGDLIKWISSSLPVDAYDIEPKQEFIHYRDSLRNPPNYNQAWILTNPPYLARNKSKSKDIYDLYNTNDLYKCFLLSVVQQGTCVGGLFILPAGFFLSPRAIDVRCRNAFMTMFKITKIRYFEEPVFEDTTTTTVAFSFEKSSESLTTQQVEWERFPSKEKKKFTMSADNHWIIGGELYQLPIPDSIRVRRYVIGQQLHVNEQQTFITLNALDTRTGRICLQYTKDAVYPAKDCSRTYATFCITGIFLTEEEQIELCSDFNAFLEIKRDETWSLCLPQYREYTRKRIPFELAYRIFLHIIFLTHSK